VSRRLPSPNPANQAPTTSTAPVNAKHTVRGASTIARFALGNQALLSRLLTAGLAALAGRHSSVQHCRQSSCPAAKLTHAESDSNMSAVSTADTHGKAARTRTVCFVRPVFGAAKGTDLASLRERSSQSAVVRYPEPVHHQYPDPALTSTARVARATLVAPSHTPLQTPCGRRLCLFSLRVATIADMHLRGGTMSYCNSG
jgi:hypothetical protein